MSDKVKFGFVGGGFVGQFGHLDNYYGNPKAKMMAIAEIRPELRKGLKAHYGFEEDYATHREMLDRSDVDAVVAVTRRPHTGPIALDVLNAGKHLFTEKPMAHTVDQAQRLLDTAKRRGLIYGVGYIRRFDAGVIEAKKIFDRLVASGELGDILSVRVHCYGGDSYCGMQSPVVHDQPYVQTLEEWPIAPSWLPEPFHKEYARYVNVYSHDVNLLTHFFPAGFEVRYADFKHAPSGLAIFDTGSFQITLETSDCATLHWDETFEVFFKKGRLSVKMPPNFLRNVPARVEVYKGGGADEQLLSPQVRWSWSFKNQADAFVNSVASGKQHPVGGEDGLRDLVVIEDCWKQFLKSAPKS